MLAHKLDKRLFFILLLLLLIPVFIFVYAVRPAQEEASRLQAEQEYRHRMYLESAEWAAVNQADHSSREVVLARIQRQIPERPYPDRILRDLRLLEVASGLQMKMYQINTEVQSAALPDELAPYAEVITITTAVEGTYQQIERMLEELETMNRLYTVDQVTLSTDAVSPIELGAEDKLITCLITLHAYYSSALQAAYPLPAETDYIVPSDLRKSVFY